MKARAVWAAVKPKIERELGLMLFMVIFGAFVVAIAVGVGRVVDALPDWAWLALWGMGSVWLFFGESIAAGVRAWRGVKP